MRLGVYFHGICIEPPEVAVLPNLHQILGFDFLVFERILDTAVLEHLIWYWKDLVRYWTNSCLVADGLQCLMVLNVRNGLLKVTGVQEKPEMLGRKSCERGPAACDNLYGLVPAVLSLMIR